MKAYLEREQAGLIPNPYPKPRYKLIDELKSMDLVNFYDEAKTCEEHCDDHSHLRIKKKLTSSQKL